MEHLWEMAFLLSNGHVSDDVNLPLTLKGKSVIQK